MLEFTWPWVFLALPLPLLINRFISRAPRQDAALYVPFFSVLSRLQSDTENLASGRLLNLICCTLIWLLIIIAASRPQWLGEPVQLPSTGRDLMLSVDISGSMEAQDMVVGNRQASRIDVVKAVVGDFVERREGGLVYSDVDASLVRPKRSRRSALHLLNQIFLYNQHLQEVKDPETLTPVDPDFKPGLAHALGQIRRITKPGSTLYVISDFITLDDKALQYLNQLSRHNNVICCLVYDALEESLPVPGIYSITDGAHKGALNTHNPKARSRYREQFSARMERLESELDKLQIRLIKMRTNQLVVEQIREWIAKNY